VGGLGPAYLEGTMRETVKALGLKCDNSTL